LKNESRLKRTRNEKLEDEEKKRGKKNGYNCLQLKLNISGPMTGLIPLVKGKE
jgi:hypothetical protein